MCIDVYTVALRATVEEGFHNYSCVALFFPNCINTQRSPDYARDLICDRANDCMHKNSNLKKELLYVIVYKHRIYILLER